MNALALWIPGTLLLVVATVLLATGRVELGIGVALIGIAVVLENGRRVDVDPAASTAHQVSGRE